MKTIYAPEHRVYRTKLVPIFATVSPKVGKIAKCNPRVWKSIARQTSAGHFLLEEWNAHSLPVSNEGEFCSEQTLARTNALAAIVELCDNTNKVLCTNAPWARSRFVDDFPIIMLPKVLQGACRLTSTAKPFGDDDGAVAFELIAQTSTTALAMSITHREIRKAQPLGIN
jgi:hypothetical protein